MGKENRISAEEFNEAVILLFEKQKRFKEVESRFKQIKTECTQVIDQYFSQKRIEKSAIVGNDDSVIPIKVTKVNRTSVTFNADKVEKALGKDIASKVIDKRYEITDIFGLIEYLKSCGVDPKIFKSFLNVTKSVNVNELERLNELGEIDEDDLTGCFTITKHDPYYKLKPGKGDGDD